MTERTALRTDIAWIHGSASRRNRTDPTLQVEELAPGTVLLRQSKDDTFEAPFILLLLGSERALLLDTGATPGEALRTEVDTQVARWVAEQGLDPAAYALVVAHTHAHGDHVAGDTAFADRPATTVVPHDAPAVAEFFGIADWPNGEGRLDLGGRLLRVCAIPGHQDASIAILDEQTGLLQTGDTVYPGRIYVRDAQALTASLDRLVAFAAEHQATQILGCHVEMTRRPRSDYPLGSLYQPDEPSPFMTIAQLTTARDAFRSVAARPGIHRFDDIIFCNGEGLRVKASLIGRSLLNTAIDRIRRR